MHRQPSRRPRLVAGLPILVVVAAAGTAPGAASAAAWLPPQPIAGSPQTIATGAAPGDVAVVAADAGTFRAYVHDPGSGAGWRVASTTTFDGDVLAGPGGALVVVHDSDDSTTTVDIGAFDSRGVWRSAGSSAIPGSVSAGAVAAGPDGTVAAAITDDDSGQLSVLSGKAGDPSLVRQDAEIDGRSAVGEVSVAPGATAGVNVAWNREGADGPQIWGARVIAGAEAKGTLLARLAPTDPTADDPTVSAAAAAARTDVPTAVWVQATEDAQAVRAVRLGGAPADVVTSPGVLQLLGAPSRTAQGRVVVPYADETGTRIAVLGDDAALVCTAPASGTPATSVGGAPALIAGVGDGRLSATAITGAGCDQAAPVFSAAVPRAPAIVAASDAADDVVAAVGQPAPGAIAVLDRTAPALEVGIDAEGGRPVRAVARSSDGWGPVTVSWKVDGVAADAPGGTLGLSGLAAGTHRITGTAVDAAGNATVREQDVRIPDTGSTDPPAPVDPGPAGTPEPTTPVAPPVTTPIPPSGTPGAKRRPSVRVLRIRRSGARWVVTVRARDADRLRVTLFRERYLSGKALGGRPTICPRRAVPARRPSTGRRGQVTVRVRGGAARLVLSGLIAKALERRGRYTIRVEAYVAKTPKRVAADRRRFSSC
ncbi:hypothetical protein [Patulibacter minatonensis]|uniref:hypothetical protein n=1 Tax=Patulibacter minatonensis TaxID=298163 RepID=UPI00047CEDC9|nr:hypothetical protein [Patulibacter minatonensis]